MMDDCAIISIELFAQSENFNEPTAKLYLSNSGVAPSFEKMRPDMFDICLKCFYNLLAYITRNLREFGDCFLFYICTLTRLFRSFFPIEIKRFSYWNIYLEKRICLIEIETNIFETSRYYYKHYSTQLFDYNFCFTTNINIWKLKNIE